jgi:hypothetical protein
MMHPQRALELRLGFTAAGGAARPSRFAILHELARGLAAPGIDDELAQLGRGDGGKAHQDGGEAVVVRLGEEALRVSREQDGLLCLVANPDREDVAPPGAPGPP